MRVTIIDYGVGNLHSLAKAVDGPGVSLAIERDPSKALDTDILVLPGVGAFPAAAAYLAPARARIRDAIRGGLPTLGICLGMQLLFDASEEGAGDGLGVFGGNVMRLRTRRVPHIGWNTVDAPAGAIVNGSPLSTAYYANSYVCEPSDSRTVVAWTTHDSHRFPAAVRDGGTLGVQFHPEKSSREGVALIQAFIRERGR